MLTESQKRALRARAMLDAGGYGTPKEIARECGYTSVNAMLGAIAMVDGLCEEKPDPAPAPAPAVTPAVKLYPVKYGLIRIEKADVSISYRPDGKSGPTVHINNELCKRITGRANWLALVGKDVGGKEVLAGMLRQIAEAVTECAALIEDEMQGGK